ncbi:MAG TPA: histidine kinase, partial [Micrococcales bacterium]|nr:histidine kinase [Micrococcales bacterium]
RLGNLTALRELALLWLADEVDSALQRYRDEHAIQDTWQARERVVVAVTSGREGETLVRRGARIAARSAGGELVVVHVIATDGLRAGDPDDLLRSRALTESLGGTFHEVVGDDVGRAVVEFARGVNATQVVVGLSRRGWWARTLGGAGVGQTIIRESGSIDVHIVSHERSAGSGPLPGRVHWLGALSRRRQLGGLLLCVLGGPLLTWVLTAARSEDTIIGDVLGYQMLVIVVALVGGLWPALLTAVLSGLTLDFFFIAPFHTITIAEPSHVAGLVLYIANAVLVSLVVDLAARTTRTARRANAESELLTQIAGSVMRGDDALAAILTQTREALGLADLRVVRGGAVLARAGVNVDGGAADAADDGAASETVPAGPDAVLEARGPVLEATQRRLLGAVAAHVEAAIEAADLTRTASTVDALTEADRVRRALLSAVSHDLRRPLAAAVTAVGALRDDSVTWSEEDRTELLDTAGESLDLLTRLVTHLLDATPPPAPAPPP